jgi:hypothetical protein
MALGRVALQFSGSSRVCPFVTVRAIVISSENALHAKKEENDDLENTNWRLR